MSDVLTITPEIWALRSVYSPDNRYNLNGVCFDGEFAAATNGSILVAKKTDEKAMPRTLVSFHGPAKIPASITVPRTPGLHAARPTKGGPVCVVEIIETGEDFPNWRSVVPKGDQPYQLFHVGNLRTLLEAADLARADFVELSLGDDLGPVKLRARDGGVAILMPCRKD